MLRPTLTAFALGLLTHPSCPSQPPDPPPVGFVWHFPFIRFQDDRIPGSGATALVARAAAGAMSEEGAIALASIDEQLAFAQRAAQEGHPLQLMYLLEANPVYAPAWLQAKVRAAGENERSFTGAEDTTPSMRSSVFAEAHRHFLQAVVNYIRERDAAGVVKAYMPGAEWWYPANLRGSPLDLAAFRDWLRRRYGKIEFLNAVWGARYATFDDVPNPGLVADSGFGETTALARFVPEQSLVDVSWSLHPPHWIPVQPGQEYVFSAWLRTRDVQGEGAHLSLSWWGKGGSERIRDVFSERLQGDRDWQRVELRVTVPARADRAWPLLKLRGWGEVWFDGVEFRQRDGEANLVPAPGSARGPGEAGPWSPDNWTHTETALLRWAAGEGRESNGCLHIRVVMPPHRLGMAHLGAAAYDANRFAYEFLGDYIQGFCEQVKRLDPTRPTAGYLTFSFAHLLEWDYVQQFGMGLGVILPRLRDLDIIGMQICSAEGDPLRVTGALDLARKYGKPMWAVDLLDFTSGVAIGPARMRKVSQAAIQHGANGLLYYCWHGTPDYDYYPGMAVEELRAMQTEAARAIERVRGMELETPVALVQPILPTAYTDPGGQRNEFRDFGGLYKALQDLGLTCDLWTLEELEGAGDALDRYQAVVLPDCAFISDRAVRTLQRYAEHAPLVRSGRWATHDEHGLPRDHLPLLRCRRLLPTGEETFGVAYLGPLLRTTHAGNTPPLFLESGDPAARAARRAALRPRLARALASVLEEREAGTVGSAPQVKFAVFRDPHRLAVFLVNEADPPAEQVRLWLKPAFDLEACSAWVDGTAYPNMPLDPVGDRILVHLPRFEHACILLVRDGMVHDQPGS